jgi:hypothetical protein
VSRSLRSDGVFIHRYREPRRDALGRFAGPGRWVIAGEIRFGRTVTRCDAFVESAEIALARFDILQMAEDRVAAEILTRLNRSSPIGVDSPP